MYNNSHSSKKTVEMMGIEPMSEKVAHKRLHA